MKKLSYRQINNVMGKEMAPIQRKFMKNNNVKLTSDQEEKVKNIIKSNKPMPFKNGKLPNNNDPCPCGSGRKFKHCCKITTS